MITSRISRTIAALTLAGVSALGLVACTGAPTASDNAREVTTAPTKEATSGDSGQTTAEACQLVQDTIAEASDEFANVSSEDPTALVQAMETAAQKISEASSQVTNEEVAALLPPLQSMFTQVAEAMTALASGDMTKVGEIQELGATFQETSTAFQELCAS